MLSKSGNPFKIDSSVQKLLKSADLIIANVESPIVDRKDKIKIDFSFSFELHFFEIKKNKSYSL
ncbi:MAG: hypothetical protein K1060chlam4_00833 [Candidatus Anoxychlamydiales bacterium]|nr:hypothetical protein [Candidatus Anoxychlamydiales bacterium]